MQTVEQYTSRRGSGLSHLNSCLRMSLIFWIFATGLFCLLFPQLSFYDCAQLGGNIIWNRCDPCVRYQTRWCYFYHCCPHSWRHQRQCCLLELRASWIDLLASLKQFPLFCDLSRFSSLKVKLSRRPHFLFAISGHFFLKVCRAQACATLAWEASWQMDSLPTLQPLLRKSTSHILLLLPH